MFINDAVWEVIGPVLEVPRKSAVGRPRSDERSCFEAVLFVLHTGIQWKHLPPGFPPKSTVHDYLKIWVAREAFRALLAKVVKMLVQQRRIDLEECFIDATFAPAKAGGRPRTLPRWRWRRRALPSAPRSAPWQARWRRRAPRPRSSRRTRGALS